MCLLACAAGSAAAQDEGDLMARQRVFPSVGPGLRSIKRGADGRLYLLASPSPGLLVFDRQGQQVLTVSELPGADPSAKTGRALITFGEDCDGDADDCGNQAHAQRLPPCRRRSRRPRRRRLFARRRRLEWSHAREPGFANLQRLVETFQGIAAVCPPADRLAEGIAVEALPRTVGD